MTCENPTSLLRFRSGIGRVVSKTGNCRIVCAGDSLTLGWYSNGSGSGDWRTNSYPGHLTTLFNAAGYPAQRNSFLGAGDGSDYQNDPHISLGTGWITGSGVLSAGGQVYKAFSATTDFSFSPSGTVDTFIIYYIQFPGYGEFTYNLNGGSNTAVNANGTSNLKSVTVSCTRGTNVLKLNWSSGGTGGAISIVGIEAIDSATPQVSIINAGWAASSSGDWSASTGNNWDPAAAIGVLAPDLVLLNIGARNVGLLTPLDTYQSDLQTVISVFSAVSDVALVSFSHFNPAIGGVPSELVQKSYVDIMQSVAEAAAMPFFDEFTRLGSFSLQNACGLSYTDGIHLIGPGYADAGRTVFNGLTSG